MQNSAELIPSRCAACPYLADDIERCKQIMAIHEDPEQITDALLFDSKTPEEIERYFAKIEAELDERNQKIEQNLARTAGCPGADLSNSIGTGEPARHVRCRSPFTELTD